MQQSTKAATLWTTNRIVALVLGIILLLLGLIGFITPEENSTGVRAIFGIFDTDTVHNFVFLVLGIIGIAMALGGQARTFNQVFGILYIIVGILGLFSAFYFPAGTYGTDQGLLFGIMHDNAGDHVLELVTGIIAAIIGFTSTGDTTRTTPRFEDRV